MFTKIDRTNKGVTGLPDTPNLSTTEMQEKFDELGAMACDGVNTLIDELEESGAESTGIMPPPGYTGDPNIQAFADDVYSKVRADGEARHTHDNKSILDTLTDGIMSILTRVAALFTNITSIGNAISDSTSTIPTSHAVVSYVQRMGGGDMMQTRYDSDGDGIVNQADLATRATDADHADYALRASSANSATNATNADRATLANDATTMGGNTLSYENGSFYIRNGSVKKKLGDNFQDKSFEVEDRGDGTASLNVRYFDDYASLRTENFYVVIVGIQPYATARDSSLVRPFQNSTNTIIGDMRITSADAGMVRVQKSYNQQTGILEISGLIQSVNIGTVTASATNGSVPLHSGSDWNISLPVTVTMKLEIEVYVVRS